MDARAPLLADCLGHSQRPWLLLLLVDLASIQQTVQSRAQQVLHQEALREAKDDDKYHPADEDVATAAE